MCQHFTENQITAFCNGDQKAFETIYNSYFSLIYKFAYYFLRCKEDAEDVTSDTFIKLWQRRAQFQNEHKILGFLRITTRNACIDFIRGKKRNQDNLLALLTFFETYSDELFFAFEEKSRELMCKQLSHSIDRLPKKSKRVMDLVSCGLKNEQIARALNISMQTLLNQKSAAIKRMRIELKTSRTNLV